MKLPSRIVDLSSPPDNETVCDYPFMRLCNLEQLPDHGFTVACFPYKVKAGWAGWTRAVALFD